MEKLHLEGEIVTWESEEWTEAGRVASFDPGSMTYKVRNARGHLKTVEFDRVSAYEDPRTRFRRIMDRIDPQKFLAYAKRAWILLAIVAFAMFAAHRTMLVAVPEKPAAVEKSRAAVLTEEINALNARNVPLIEACGKMRENDAEIRTRVSELGSLKYPRSELSGN